MHNGANFWVSRLHFPGFFNFPGCRLLAGYVNYKYNPRTNHCSIMRCKIWNHSMYHPNLTTVRYITPRLFLAVSSTWPTLFFLWLQLYRIFSSVSEICSFLREKRLARLTLTAFTHYKPCWQTASTEKSRSTNNSNPSPLKG